MLGKWNATGFMLINQMNKHYLTTQRSLERISSGIRINRASDDPAGLAISEKMRAQIRGLNMAGRNIQDGISLLQTAEGGLNETHAILQRMRELSIQAANDTYTDEDRQVLALEFEELKKEITRISNDTEFNTKPLLNGSDTTFSIQAGANAGQSIQFSIAGMGAISLGIDDLSIDTRDKAEESISFIDDAITFVSSERSKLGAYMNRLEHAYNNTMTMEENLIAAKSRIRDADIAKEIMNYTEANLLLQANQYVLSLHMQQAQSVLQLLKM